MYMLAGYRHLLLLVQLDISISCFVISKKRNILEDMLIRNQNLPVSLDVKNNLYIKSVLLKARIMGALYRALRWVVQQQQVG